MALAWALISGSVLSVAGQMVLAGVSCPPRPSVQPEICGTIISDEHADVAHLGMSRVLFDHASAVYDIAADALEFSEEAPMEIFSILRFLNNLRDFLCHARYRWCNLDGLSVALSDAVHEACDVLSFECSTIAACTEIMDASGGLCHELDSTAWPMSQALARLATYTAEFAWKSRGFMKEPTLAKVLALSTPWAREGKQESVFFEACRVASPHRIGVLDGSWKELDHKQAKLLSAMRAVEVLGGDGLELGPAPLVVNLGAGLIDSASCLVERGATDFTAVFFEVDPLRVADLQARYRHRPQVQLITHIVEPKDFPEAVLNAYWNRVRQPRPAAGARLPALLKIDVDNGDCDYLEAWLKTGYKPLVISIEVMHSYVPAEIALNLGFERARSSVALSEQHAFGAYLSVGCSLGYMLELLNDEYSLLSWGHVKPVNGEFVLSTWAAEQNLDVVAPHLIPRFWREHVSYREVWHHDHYHGLHLDPRTMLGDTLSQEEKEADLAEAQLILRRRLGLAAGT